MRYVIVLLVVFSGVAFSGERRTRSYMEVNGQSMSLLYSDAAGGVEAASETLTEPQQMIKLLAEIEGLLEQVLALMSFWAGLFLWRLFVLSKSQRNLI